MAERRIKLTGKLLSAYTVLENTKGSGDLPPAVFVLVVGVRLFILFKWNLKKILKLRNLYKIFNVVLSWIHSIGSLSNLEASVMCKWWLLLHRVQSSHVCIYHSFLSDEMTSSSYLITSS